MIKTVVHDPAALQTPSTPATPADAAVGQDLLDTLAANADACVGMGANMIGVNKRIIVVQMGPFATVMYNPTIVKKAQPYPAMEGCLSLTGERSTTRYQTVTLKFLDRQFKPQQQEFNGFIAQIIQHEVDHCNGVLI